MPIVAVAEGASFSANVKPLKKQLFSAAPSRWYEVELEQSSCSVACNAETVASALIVAEQLLVQECALYSQEREKRNPADTRWLKTASTSGTFSDRIAALALQAQESPIHNLKQLESLAKLLQKKSQREAFQIIDTLKDLYLQCLLPNRKLIPFSQRPLLSLYENGHSEDDRHRCLSLWYFEHELKRHYGEFIATLRDYSRDTLDSLKIKCIKVLFEMLSTKPEQEQELLSTVVNKLVDPNYKVAARVVHCLSKLLQAHPMHGVVVDEVERVVYRHNVSQRAQYYALCFLSQISLKRSDTALAGKLIRLYFNLFKLLLQKDEFDNRLMGILLVALNRAIPFFNDPLCLSEETNALYKLVAVSENFHTSIQGLLLLFQVAKAAFYGSLYRKLNDPLLFSCSLQANFFNLLLNALRADPVDRRVQAFVKRLLQICFHETPAFVCATLLLISGLIKERPQLLVLRFNQADLCQKNNNANLIDESKHLSFLVGDNEEECFKDVHSEESDTEEKSTMDDSKPKSASWFHRQNLKASTRFKKENKPAPERHDRFCRNPLFAGMEFTLHCELVALSRHYHPSVALFAQQLLECKQIDYTSDPLQDFTLIKFLDRFVYKKPKQQKSGGGSVMFKKSNVLFHTQESGAASKINRKSEKMSKTKQLHVFSDEYAQKSEKEVPVDERFLHRYISSVSRPKASKAVVDGDATEFDDVQSVNSDEFEQLLERFEPGERNDEFSLADLELPNKNKKKKKKPVDSDSGDDLDDDFSQAFINDDDFKNAFAEYDTCLDQQLSETEFDAVDFAAAQTTQKRSRKKDKKHEDLSDGDSDSVTEDHFEPELIDKKRKKQAKWEKSQDKMAVNRNKRKKTR